jgi:hypothetical protein
MNRIAFIATLLAASPALAAESPPTEKLAAPTGSIELGLSTGYDQGFGDVDRHSRIKSLGEAGAGVAIRAGYRLVPHLTLGAYGTIASFSPGDGVDGTTSVTSATTGFEATWHFRPEGARVAPWLALGTGFRTLDVSAGKGSSSFAGFEVARLELGADYRFSDSIAIGPTIGADASVFFAGAASPSTIVFAGLSGRFEITPQLASR